MAFLLSEDVRIHDQQRACQNVSEWHSHLPRRVQSGELNLTWASQMLTLEQFRQAATNAANKKQSMLILPCHKSHIVSHLFLELRAQLRPDLGLLECGRFELSPSKLTAFMQRFPGSSIDWGSPYRTSLQETIVRISQRSPTCADLSSKTVNMPVVGPMLQGEAS